MLAMPRTTLTVVAAPIGVLPTVKVTVEPETDTPEQVVPLIEQVVPLIE